MAVTIESAERMTPGQRRAALRRVGQRCITLAAQQADALALREALIRQLVEQDGMLRQDVAALAQITPSRVGQICPRSA